MKDPWFDDSDLVLVLLLLLLGVLTFMPVWGRWLAQ